MSIDPKEARSIELLYEIPDWYDEAQCQGTSQQIFFPQKNSPQLESIAKSICAACAVTEQCLEYALLTRQTEGIWGGKTAKERRRIRRQTAVSA